MVSISEERENRIFEKVFNYDPKVFGQRKWKNGTAVHGDEEGCWGRRWERGLEVKCLFLEVVNLRYMLDTQVSTC